MLFILIDGGANDCVVALTTNSSVHRFIYSKKQCGYGHTQPNDYDQSKKVIYYRVWASVTYKVKIWSMNIFSDSV